MKSENMKIENANEHPWDYYHQYGTDYPKTHKVILFNDEYGYFVDEDDKCYTVEGFKAIREVVCIVRDQKRVATFFITSLWRRYNMSYSAQEYVIGFDDHDQSLHDISMWLHSKMLVDDALCESVAMNVDCLELAPFVENESEILDASIDIAKHIGKTHGKKPVEYLLFTFSSECQSLDKITETVSLIKGTKSANSTLLNTQYWQTGLVERQECIHLNSYRELLLKL